MKKRIAIIGANEAIAILIEKAKAMGYETHVFAWKSGDPGEKAADFFYPIDISEKEKVLDICRKVGICGVCSITSDYAAPVVAYIARNLGLPGNPEKTDIVARNKYQMRKAFKEYGGIYCPKFEEVGTEYDSTLFKNFNFPVIVKPTDRWSSKGITRVDEVSQLHNAITYAISESFEKKAIVEEFMEGPEYSAECIVYNGEPTILTFTQKKTTGYPHYIESGHIQPSDIALEKQERIKEIVKRAILALDITNSAAHAEFRLLDNGDVGFMEIGARMGGDCIGTDLTPISTGMDYVRMVIDVACGNKPCLDIVSKPTPVAIDFIINEDSIRQYNAIEHDRIIRQSTFDENFNNCVVDSSTRHGYYIYRC